MVRSLFLVVLVALLIASGVALAAPAGDVRLPVTVTGTGTITEKPDEVIVEKGDHLWKISARHLEAHSPGLRVAPYWLRVIEVNTPSLRSGDPDLIYPGEVIRLPSVSEQR